MSSAVSLSIDIVLEFNWGSDGTLFNHVVII